MKREVKPYYRQKGVPHVTSNKGAADRVECRVSPDALRHFCRAAKANAQDLAPDTAHYIRCLEVFLRESEEDQWESIVLVARREQIGACWQLLYRVAFTRHLQREVVFELRGAWGAALGGFWQRKYLPEEWDRDHEEFAPTQGELAL